MGSGRGGRYGWILESTGWEASLGERGQESESAGLGSELRQVENVEKGGV